MIDSYSFGNMVIDGIRYSSDLIIFPDGQVTDSWWREKGHILTLEDISALIASAPEIIVAGTGASGLMRPAQGLEKILSEKKIRLLTAPSTEAVEIYNLLSIKHRVGAGFHLTC